MAGNVEIQATNEVKMENAMKTVLKNSLEERIAMNMVTMDKTQAKVQKANKLKEKTFAIEAIVEGFMNHNLWMKNKISFFINFFRP
jgi:23S rRNA C2498 (ribose-2'-O)-methylase RlmM